MHERKGIVLQTHTLGITHVTKDAKRRLNTIDIIFHKNVIHQGMAQTSLRLSMVRASATAANRRRRKESWGSQVRPEGRKGARGVAAEAGTLSVASLS